MDGELAQLVRARDSNPLDRGFESLTHHNFGGYLSVC